VSADEGRASRSETRGGVARSTGGGSARARRTARAGAVPGAVLDRRPRRDERTDRVRRLPAAVPPLAVGNELRAAVEVGSPRAREGVRDRQQRRSEPRVSPGVELARRPEGGDNPRRGPRGLLREQPVVRPVRRPRQGRTERRGAAGAQRRPDRGDRRSSGGRPRRGRAPDRRCERAGGHDRPAQPGRRRAVGRRTGSRRGRERP